MKRTYGLPITLYSQTLGVTDPKTGKKSSTYQRAEIRRAIVQPARHTTSFVYDLSYISANKDFTTGGFFDTSDRRVIIDGKDLPLDWEMDLDQFVVFNNKRYDLKSINEFDLRLGFILVMREVKGQQIVRIETCHSVLTMQQSVTGVVV